MDLARSRRRGVDLRDNVVSPVSKYSPEERYRILADARETLERLDAEKADRAERDAEPAWPTRRDILDPSQRSSEPMRRWRAEQEEWSRKCEQETKHRHAEEQRIMTERKAQSDTEWNVWVTAIITRELAAHDRNLTKVLGQVVAKIRKQLRDEIQTAVGELRAELNMQREHAAKFGEVIDLPSPLIRKVKDSAA
jgi:hypothetical protein